MKRRMAMVFGLGLTCTALALIGGCGDTGSTSPSQSNSADVPESLPDTPSGDGSTDSQDGTPPDDASDGPDVTTEDTPPVGPDVCVPNCEGKACGDNGCGASCGDCADSDDPCTDAVCDQGTCTTTFTDASCDDDNPCTEGDLCSEGACAGTLMDCEDDNSCTDNWCNQGVCMTEPSEEDACQIVITIDTPTRAAILQNLDVVTVSGTVSSPAALVDHVTLGDVDVGIDSEGAFSTNIVPKVGINILEASAKNALDQEHQVAQSFLYGETFHPEGTLQSPTVLDDAMGLWLSPQAFDDGDPTDIDDFAALAFMVLDSLDLNTMLPNPLFPQDERPSFLGCDYDVEVSDISIVIDEVEFAPVTGGVKAYFEIENLYAYISAESDDGIIGDNCPDAKGPVTASLVTVDGNLSVAVIDGAPVVTIASEDDLVVTIYDFDWELEEGLASVFNFMMPLVIGTIEDTIIETLQTQMQDNIVPLVNDLLADFTAFERVFVIPAFRTGGNNATINLQVGLADADFTEAGVHLSLTVGSSADKELDIQVPGTLANANCEDVPTPPLNKLPKNSVTEAYLDVDLSNQILHGLWASGYINTTITEDTLGDTTETYGLSDPQITLTPLLPPIISTCTDLGDAEIQMGDVHVLAEFDSAVGPLVLDIYASGVVGAELTIYDVPDAPDALGIESVNTGIVALDLQSFEGDLTLFSYEAIELLLSSILSDVLAGDLLVGLVGAFPLPTVPVGGYVPGLPEDATLSFDPHTLNGVGAHLILGGNLATE